MKTHEMKEWITPLPTGKTPQFEKILSQLDNHFMAKYQNHAVPKKTANEVETGVMKGISGELLYMFYSSVYHDEQALYDTALYYIEQLASDAENHTNLNFCSGLSGFLWSLYHLENTNMVPDAACIIDKDAIDILFKHWITQINDGNYDYMHGGLSVAMPLIESKRKTDKHFHYLEQIVDALDKSAIKSEGVTYWNFELVGLRSVSIGLSHGLCGIVVILSKICQQGVAMEKSKNLIERTLKYILDRRNKRDRNFLFPTSIKQDRPNNTYPAQGRISWCTGDINIAIALLYASKVINNDSYKQEAALILKYVIDHMSINEQFTTEAGFCHGAFGNGHLFSRIYNVTGNADFRTGADFWYNKALRKTTFENSSLKLSAMIGDTHGWSSQTNVLTGTAGVGLTILSAVSNTQPEWDSLFLLNL